MIKRNQRYFNWINRLSDMALVYIAYLAAVSFWIFWLKNDTNNISIRYAWANPWPVLILAAVFVVIFQYGGLYDSFRYQKLRTEMVQLLKLHVLCVMLGVGCVFLFKLRDFSRGVMVSYAVIAYALLALKRAVIRTSLNFVRKNGLNQKHVLLVGGGRLAARYVACIKENPQFGFQCAGYVGQDGNLKNVKYLGTYDQLSELLDIYEPDEVIIALEENDISQLNSIILSCEKHGIRSSIIPIYNDYLPACATVDAIGRIRLINIRGNSQDLAINRAIKRTFDILFSSVVILLLSPLLLAIALGVKLSSPGPVLFKQKRVGKERKLFTMYKFRSMCVNDQSDTAWSRSRDSRITRFGAFIRKFSLDELPQFFNVLRGEMSVVGPRPELPFFVDQYKENVPLYMVKHQVKPGLTGWAQVNGYRGDTSIEKRIEYDIWYIENWSIYLDIKIIFMTIFGGMINAEKNLFKEEQKEKVEV